MKKTIKKTKPAEPSITERKRAELTVKQSPAWQEAIFEGSRDAIFITDVDSRLSAVNAAACQLTGYSREELLTMRIPDLHAEVDLNAYRTYHDPILAGQEILSGAKILQKDGSKVDAEFSNRRIVIKGVPFMHTTARDITERRRAEEALRVSEERYHLLFDTSLDAILLTAPDGSILSANPSACRMFGRTEEEIIQVGRSGVLDTSDPRLAMALEERNRTDKFIGELTFIRKDGTKFPGELSSSLFKDKDGFARTSMIIRDITARKRVDEELRRVQASDEEAQRELQQAFAREQDLARTDALTGVNNRRYWFALAEHEFEVATRYRHPFSVILFDIDRFKLVNDTFGHAVGDQILERVAHVARATLRSADVIGRYGGEEFVIVLPLTTASQAYLVAERIRATVGAIKVETDKGQTAVTLSIGIAETLLALPTERPGGDDTIERIIHRADEAMYAAKAAGRNRTSIFSAPAGRPGGST